MLNLFYKSFILLSVITLFACDEQTANTQASSGSIAPSIIWQSRDAVESKPSVDDIAYAAIPVGAGTTLPTDLTTVRIIVSGNGITSSIQRDFSANARSGIINNIPNGSNHTVTVQGLNSSNTIVYEGFKNGIAVTSGGTTLVNITALERLNELPTANAGTDQSVNSGASVSLTGNGSDIGGVISSYSWSQISGTTVTITGNNTANASFTAPTVTTNITLTFRLVVTDNGGETATDDVTVIVNSTAASNASPTANAGTDQTVASGTAASLAGSGNDTDGTIASYSWSQIGGATVSITGSNTTNASFIAPTVTTDTPLPFQLTVTDNDGATASDTVIVTVSTIPNTSPTANAGTDQTAQSGETVNLAGSGNDTDGTIASYSWSQIGGTTVTITGSNTANASFTAPDVDSTLTFQLTVTDDGGATATDDVVITVTAPESLSISNASKMEGDIGSSDLAFTVSLSGTAPGPVDVDYATSNGTAIAGSDYTATSGTLTILSGTSSGIINIPINGDIEVEGHETFTLTLSNPANAVLGSPVVATGTITNDDIAPATKPLNDTGITTCSDASTNGLTCPQIGYEGQDAEYGRDLTVNNDTDGHAGFSFTKLDSNGIALPFSAPGWDCVLDNITGLIWEMKTTTGLQTSAYTYTWYNSTGINDGGLAGTANGGVCFDAVNCDTEKFVAAVNATGLCGASDWHLPSRYELLSIVNNNIDYPSIDVNYFPNSQIIRYWTSSPNAEGGTRAWSVHFIDGYVNDYVKSTSYAVRLVRGGQ